MKALLPHAEKIAALLKARKETIAVAESSAGGLISAALLAQPGASAYFVGGGVVYTRKALFELVRASADDVKGVQPSSEAYALVKARLVRERLGTTWGIGETGAAGPTGSRYGYPAGHACIGVSGPVERARTLETGSEQRTDNMYAFATAALELLVEALQSRK